MAPFIARPDLGGFLMLFSVVLLLAFIAHRIVRMLPIMRRVAPGWASWERRDFPMGLALGGVLLTYLTLKAFQLI